MPREVNGFGDPTAKIMLVGEAPGAEEDQKGLPFQGASGWELAKMLQESGITQRHPTAFQEKGIINWKAAGVYITNVARQRPPDNNITHFIPKAKKDVTSRHTLFRDRHVSEEIQRGVAALKSEIDLVRPNIVVALGNVPLWVLTGRWGILQWRGSMLYSDIRRVKVIPTIHPAAVLRQWNLRGSVITDLKRAVEHSDTEPFVQPDWRFTIRPDFPTALNLLRALLEKLQSQHSVEIPLRISFDLETLNGHIACAGLSWSLTEALCLPFIYGAGHYWTLDQEWMIIGLLKRILCHKHAFIVGQNILYDCQYTDRWWLFIPNVGQDCMIAWHSIFSDLPKALAFQASMLCNYYVYWKQEGKGYTGYEGHEKEWHYNCQDCVYTDEVGREELKIVDQLGLREVYQSQQQLFWPVLRTMLRGVRVDQEKRTRLLLEVQEEIRRRNTFLEQILGHKFNEASTKQMRALFYDDLKLPLQWTRATKSEPARVTLNDDALQKLAKIEPLVKPLVNAIADIRTLGIFEDMLTMPLDFDQRMRTAYNIGGSESGKSAPKTFRLSSSKNAFGSGGNLQTIPSEKSKSLGKAKNRGAISGLGDPYNYPNLREMFVPDPGFTFFDGDLDRADLQVVAWECEDELLKSALRMGADIHLVNCYALQGRDPPALEELVEEHPKYWDHRGPLKHLREFSKVFCHATDYLGKPRTVAAATGRTVHEIDRAQKIWFGAHPGILSWHTRIISQVERFRFVENRFGYRWYIFDRSENILPEAVAWIPQSTVSNVINQIWKNVDRQWNPHIQILLQTHDSISGQFEDSWSHLAVQLIEQCANVTIPYPDPLVIPFSVKTSKESWGSCE